MLDSILSPAVRIAFLGRTSPSLLCNWLFLLLIKFSSLVGSLLAKDGVCDDDRNAASSSAPCFSLD